MSQIDSNTGVVISPRLYPLTGRMTVSEYVFSDGIGKTFERAYSIADFYRNHPDALAHINRLFDDNRQGKLEHLKATPAKVERDQNYRYTLKKM